LENWTKILEIEWMIWNKFHYWNIVSNSTYFEINLRFFPNFEFLGGWILKDTVLTKATTPVYKHGNIVLQYGLQTLLYDMRDKHRLTLKTEGDVEFERGLSVKHILEIYQVWRN
jgi:hypothetical protein